jgi:hypothetical protein
MNLDEYEAHVRKLVSAEARIRELKAGLRRIKAGIEKYATDTVWIGEFETACDAIELLLGPTASDGSKP